MVETYLHSDMDYPKAEERDHEIIKLIHELSGEYDNKVKMISSSLNEFVSDLKHWQDKLDKEHLIKSNTANLFSPIIRSSDTEEIKSNIKSLEDRIGTLMKERDRCIHIKSKLTDSISYIEEGLNKTVDLGLNILDSQEQDRQRIARDLHDTTVQNLTVLVHKIELCSRLVDLDPVRARLELMTMSSTVKSTINEMREIIYNLRPMSLEDLGLIATVELFIKQLKLSHDIKINFKHNSEYKNVLPVINLALFRVVQEACHNVIKHAEATKIEIQIFYENNSIYLSIADNGIGFDLNNAKCNSGISKSGYGLSIMRERVFLLSGSLEVQSEIKKGTNIIINVPLKECEGDKNE